MFTPSKFRAKAMKFADLAKAADSPESAREFQKQEQSFITLADNEEWLSEHYDETVHAPTEGSDDEAASAINALSLAVEEEQILRYLGAALIMQWNTLPTKLQRELFDMASSMGKLLETASLRGQIARFLHKHKNDKPAA